MGRMIVTNDHQWKGKLVEEFTESGFRLSGDDGEITVFHKLNINNENYYQEGEDCIACAGTFIYKEEIGEKALSIFLHDAKAIGKSNILSLREQAVGMYAVAMRIDGTTYIFVDNESIYQFFYFVDNNRYLATSTIYHIAQQTQTDLDKEQLFKWLSVRSYYDSSTCFQGVRKLGKDELLVANGEICEIQEYPAEKVCLHLDDFDRTADELERQLANIGRIKKKVFHKSILYLTGGGRFPSGICFECI